RAGAAVCAAVGATSREGIAAPDHVAASLAKRRQMRCLVTNMTDTSEVRFVPTNAIKQAVAGREEEVLDALGVDWRRGRPHIHCPYRGHPDRNPSWRWDARARKAFCSCNTADSIFDVVMKVEGIAFEAAKIRVAELLKHDDLIKTKRGGDRGRAQYQRTDA